MEFGARRFTFLYRYGVDSLSVAKLVANLEAAGAIVQVVRGDATSRDDVVRAINGIPVDSPSRMLSTLPWFSDKAAKLALRSCKLSEVQLLDLLY
ncbi:hypothetical protein TrVGV298_006233 [Trichoderma virens]|nr:hypothetical protein TrVGV298_006233 [Trichoderma virens]